ncbi:TolB family protein [candidate division KSB1 bacterium]
MKKMISSLVLIYSLLTSFNAISQGRQLTDLSGPYLGQKPPGMKAELFDPGIFPENEGQGCSGFLNDGTVFVFTSMRRGTDWRFRPTYVTELKDGRWTKPEIAPFSEYLPYNFTVGPGGQILYFTTLKSPDKTTSMLLEQGNIWAVSLHKNGWTEPYMLGASINTEKYYENYPAVALNGTIYYMSRRDGGIGRTDVYRSKNLDGRYGPAENLGPVINTELSDQDPFIAPDESYLIICQVKNEGLGQYDLYVSFSKEDGSWTELINMGPDVNSSEYEFRPYVTPDGKYLFFTSNRDGSGNIYWVDAKIIERLKPDDIK